MREFQVGQTYFVVCFFIDCLDRICEPKMAPKIKINKVPQTANPRKKSIINKELFIEEVRKYPYLFDLANDDYKDTHLKDIRWASIGALFKVSGEEAYSTWKSLRDRYRKIVRDIGIKKRSGVAVDDVPKPTWPLYNVLDGFLQSSVEPRETASNDCSLTELPGTDFNLSNSLDDVDGSDENAHILLNSMEQELDIGGLQSDDENDEEKEFNSSKLSASNTTPLIKNRITSFVGKTLNSSKATETKKRKRNELDLKFEKMMELSEKTLFTQFAANQNRDDKDEIFHYFSSLMGRFRSLTDKQQKEARFKIEELFYSLEK